MHEHDEKCLNTSSILPQGANTDAQTTDGTQPNQIIGKNFHKI